MSSDHGQDWCAEPGCRANIKTSPSWTGDRDGTGWCTEHSRFPRVLRVTDPVIRTDKGVAMLAQPDSTQADLEASRRLGWLSLLALGALIAAPFITAAVIMLL